MKSGEWRLAAIGITLLGAGAVGTRLSQGAMRDAVLPGGCRTPVRVLAPRAPQAVGSAGGFFRVFPRGRVVQNPGPWVPPLRPQGFPGGFPPARGGGGTPFLFPPGEEDRRGA